MVFARQRMNNHIRTTLFFFSSRAMDHTAEYRAKPGDQVVDKNDTWTRYTFPVEPGRRSMRSTRRGTGIYSSQYVSMIAKWTGQ